MSEADNVLDDDEIEDLDDEFDDDTEDDDGQNDDGQDDDDGANRIPAATARAVLDYLVRALVDDPDAVEIDAAAGRRGISLRVSVAPGDLGRVIGKRGRTANAVRAVTRAAAVRDGVEVDVDFVD